MRNAIMKSKLNVFFILSGALLFVSCSYNIQKKTPQNQKFSLEAEISYQTVKSYSLSSCMSCHSGHQTPDLSTYQNILIAETRIVNEITTDSMPPIKQGYDLLTTCQKDLYLKWVELGSPEKSSFTVADVPSCKSAFNQPDITPILLMPLNYQTLKNKILGPKCIMCHSSGNSAEELPFYPYQDLMMFDRLWSKPAEQSKIYDEITNKQDGMPPVDSGIHSLTDEEIEFVRRWIEADLPEN